MRSLGPRLIVAAMVIVYLASAVLIEVLHARSGQVEDDPVGSIALLLAFTAYMTVGVLIVLRRPGNVMGWILSSVALLVTTGAFAFEYVVYALEELSRDAPGLIPAAWLAEWYWYPTLALVLFFTPFLFPNGRPASPRWRPVLWLGIAITGLTTAMAALSPTLGEPDFSLPNPIGVAGMPDVEASVIGNVLFILLGCVDPRCGGLGGRALQAFPRRRTAAAEVVHDCRSGHRADTANRGPPPGGGRSLGRNGRPLRRGYQLVAHRHRRGHLPLPPVRD